MSADQATPESLIPTPVPGAVEASPISCRRAPPGTDRSPFGLFLGTASVPWSLATWLGTALLLLTGTTHAYDVSITSGASSNGAWSGSNPEVWTPSAAGSTVSAADIAAKLANGPVTLVATDGDPLTVHTRVTWNANTLTLSAGGDIHIQAVLDGSGTAGLALEYGQNALAAGNTSRYNINAPVNLASTGSFSTKLGSDGTVKNYTVITSLGAAGSTTGTDLQGMQGDLAGNYVLGADIDASATSGWNGGAGFQSIGGAEDVLSNSNYYTGQFDGLGHVISGLTINRPSQYYLGLFGKATGGARIAHVGLRDVSFVGNVYVGGLLGLGLTATIERSYVTGTVTGSDYVGGILGRDVLPVSSVTLRNVWSSADVTGTVPGTGVNSWSGGVAGGLIGMGGRVYDSYATGNVRGGNQVGGLIGVGLASTINNAYFSGTVGIYAGTSIGVGGIMGSWANGSIGAGINNVYWNTDTAGSTGLAQVSSSGTITNLTGLTTAQMRDAANFAGFSFTTTPGGSGWVLIGNDGTWNGSNGTVLPMLASEWSSVIHNLHQLQLMTLNKGAHYTLANDLDASATNGGANDVWLGSSFMPVGTTYLDAFSGSFDGQYHIIDQLTIHRPYTDRLGLFGSSYASFSRIGLTNISVTGGDIIGSLAAGALNGSSISECFATGNLSGGLWVGGLVGNNGGTLTNSYAATSLSGIYLSTSGGIAGSNNSTGTISNSYALGAVGGPGSGGLVGASTGTVHHNFWDTTTTGKDASSGIGTNGGSSYSNAGLASADMKTLAPYSGAGWDIDDAGNTGKVWRIYAGHTTPLLRGFFTAPLTVTANPLAKVQDDIPFSGGNGITYSAPPDARLLGTLDYAGTSQGATAPGAYDMTPVGLYSSQRGYDIAVLPGTLTIEPAGSATHAIAVSAGPGGTASCTPNPVNHGGSASCTATPDSGYVFAGWSGGCMGSNPVCTLVNVATVQNITANFLLEGGNTYAGPSATGSGPIVASFSGGGSGCSFVIRQYIPVAGVPAAPPAGVTFPHGLFDFTTEGCTPGATLDFTLTYPSPLPAGTQYWKYGPTADNTAYHWYTLPATVSGATISFSITDGGLGDDDLDASNGRIVDQGGPGHPSGNGAVAIPVLGPWGLLLLPLLMTLAARRQRQRRFD